VYDGKVGCLEAKRRNQFQVVVREGTCRERRAHPSAIRLLSNEARKRRESRDLAEKNYG